MPEGSVAVTLIVTVSLTVDPAAGETQVTGGGWSTLTVISLHAFPPIVSYWVTFSLTAPSGRPLVFQVQLKLLPTGVETVALKTPLTRNSTFDVISGRKTEATTGTSPDT